MRKWVCYFNWRCQCSSVCLRHFPFHNLRNLLIKSLGSEISEISFSFDLIFSFPLKYFSLSLLLFNECMNCCKFCTQIIITKSKGSVQILHSNGNYWKMFPTRINKKDGKRHFPSKSWNNRSLNYWSLGHVVDKMQFYRHLHWQDQPLSFNFLHFYGFVHWAEWTSDIIQRISLYPQFQQIFRCALVKTDVQNQ
jgi:hypothetical protein